MPGRPTSPLYTGAPHPDPRVHGPEFCPHRCDGCPDGRHHWLDDGIYEDEWGESDPRHPDTEADASDDPHHALVKAFDREHGTEHRYGFYGCKHCDAWAEFEFIEDQEDDEDPEPLLE